MTQDTENQILTELRALSDRLEKAIADNEKFDDRFTNYQKATQWVVQLAFTLIASATITIIVTTILKR